MDFNYKIMIHFDLIDFIFILFIMIYFDSTYISFVY